MNHLDKLQQFLPNIGNRTEVSTERLDACLDAIRETIQGSFRGRKPSLSPSNTNLTARQIWFILEGDDHCNTDQFKPTARFKMLVNSVVEHVLVLLMEEAGVDVKVNKEKVKLSLTTPDGHVIDMAGSYDYEIDGKIVDCKVVEPTNYSAKFKNSEKLKENDMFGYFNQAYCYSLATGKDFAGWDVLELSKGKMKFVPVNQEDLDGNLDKFLSAYDEAKRAKTYEDAHCEFSTMDKDSKIRWQCSRCPFRDKCWEKYDLVEDRRDEVVRHIVIGEAQ